MVMIFLVDAVRVYIFDVDIINDVSLRRIHSAAKRAHESAQQTGQQQTYQANGQKIIDHRGQYAFKVDSPGASARFIW
jgi:hypothetical protein